MCVPHSAGCIVNEIKPLNWVVVNKKNRMFAVLSDAEASRCREITSGVKYRAASAGWHALTCSQPETALITNFRRRRNGFLSNCFVLKHGQLSLDFWRLISNSRRGCFCVSRISTYCLKIPISPLQQFLNKQCGPPFSCTRIKSIGRKLLDF